jgi:hypothetical protein
MPETFYWAAKRQPRDGLGFAEDYFAEANGEGNPGEGADVLGGIRGQDDEVRIHAFGDATGVRRVTEARSGIGGERSENLLEGEPSARHQAKFLGRVKVVGVPDVGAEEDLASSVGVRLKLLGCGAHVVRGVFC